MTMVKGVAFDIHRVRDRLEWIDGDLARAVECHGVADLESVRERLQDDCRHLDKVLKTLVWSADSLKPAYR